MYVDDLLMIGGPENIIADVRQGVEMEDPSDLNKHLGCYHTIARVGHVTHVQRSMEDCLWSSVCMFETEASHELTPAPTPLATDVSREQFQANTQQPGVLGPLAAKCLMKLLYAARS